MPANDALLDVLTHFAETLANRFDVADVLYALTDHTVDVLDATAAGVSLADDHDVLQFVSANSETAAELERVQQQARQGPCHHAHTSGHDVIVDDITTHDEWPVYRDTALELDLRSMMGIPLAIGEQRLGALNVYSQRKRTWTDTDVAHARVLANIATSYILHASHLDEIRNVNEQLRHALGSRIIIEQAKGLLAGEYGTTLDASLALLRHHARSNNATLCSVAEAVVELGLRPPPTS